jgi:hypothetical protein
MLPRWPFGASVILLLVTATGQAPEPNRPSEPEAEGLNMTRAVACLSIDGYDRFEPLPGAELTSEEKLLVYYRPLHYTIDREGSNYHVHLTQDGEIHHRGEKAALQRKANMVDYEIREKTSPDFLFVRNTVSLKGLKPGDYDFVIILHDALGKKPPAQQVMPFRIVPVKLPKPEGEGGKEKP